MTCAGARPIKFILDTNFLTIPSQFRIDIFRELEGLGKTYVYTLDRVVEELQVLASGAGHAATHARLALLLVKKNGIKIIKTKSPKENTDDLIVKIAKMGYVVCTLDRELIKKLRKDKIAVVSMRQGKFLEWVR